MSVLKKIPLSLNLGGVLVFRYQMCKLREIAVEGEVFIVDNKGECSQRHLEGSRTGRVVDGTWPADWVCPWGGEGETIKR